MSCLNIYHIYRVTTISLSVAGICATYMPTEAETNSGLVSVIDHPLHMFDLHSNQIKRMNYHIFCYEMLFLNIFTISSMTTAIKKTLQTGRKYKNRNDG